MCPICFSPSQEVSSRTVKHLVKDHLTDTVQEGKYAICMSEDCAIVYYSADLQSIYKVDDINTPIWFKKDADPKYICYCDHITEQQIFDAVKNDGARTINDIMRLTGAMDSCNCEINNPLGKCCGAEIQKTINKALKMQ